MKRIPIIIAAMLALSAMPVNADELSYALQYEASIKSEPLVAKWQPFYRLLNQRLNADRTGVLDYVGSVKADMCALGVEKGNKKYFGIWERHYANKPQTASNALSKRADYFMLIELNKIDCE
jgi:hypothetical protein